MRISQLELDNAPHPLQSVLVYDPNEPSLSDRVKRVLLSNIFGQTGPNGEDGASAYEVWLALGNVGTQQDFINDITGADGKSAYQSWVDQGNVGNESEFLDSLIGPIGPDLYQVWLDAGHVGTRQDFLDTITGIPGTPGTIIYNGSTAPNDANGIDGDFYINDVTGDFYHKASGTWGVPIYSLKGANGSLWHIGTGVPGAGTGVNGDFYLDSVSGNIYGPKAAGAWGSSSGNIKGPQGNTGNTGATGSLILSGTGVPSNALGRNNDYYINISNGDYYGPKSAGVWGSPSIRIYLSATPVPIKNGADVTQFTRTLESGFAFDNGGDTTLTFDTVNNKLIISSTTSWATLQSKPTTRTGFGLTDVYTGAETDQAITDALVFSNIQSKPTTIAGYGITDAYTKTETDTEIDNAIQALGNPIRYSGSWNASTNTPTLSDSDVGLGGYLYRVSVAGDVNFGNGSIHFDAGDRVVNNGTVWEKWDMTDAVLTTDDVAEGSLNKYLTIGNLETTLTPYLLPSSGVALSWAGGFLTASLINGGVTNQYLETPSFFLHGYEITLGTTVGLDDVFAFTTTGLLKRSGAETYEIATAGTDYAAPTNGTNGDVMTSNGAGGFGTPLVPGVDLATLVAGKIPSGQLPSFVDDVIEVNIYADLPVTGEGSKIYVVIDGEGTQPNNSSYRWSGSAYVHIVASPGTTDNVTEGTTNLYFTVTRARSALGTTNGILKGDGSGTVSAATAGTDYAEPTNGTSGNILTSDGTGGFGTPIQRLFDLITISTDTTLSAPTNGAIQITVLIDASAGPVVITLPAASTIERILYIFKKIDSSGNLVTLIPEGVSTIDGETFLDIVEPMQAWTVQSNGTNLYLY